MPTVRKFLFSLLLAGQSSARVPRSPATAQPVDLPLTLSALGFLAPISIGSPPQSVISLMDWTWINQFTLSTLCLGSPHDTSACLVDGQAFFNQSKSSTFKNQTSLYPGRTWNPNGFFGPLPLTVQFGSDIQHVGPLSAPVTFMLADMQFPQPSSFPFTGVFGLSPVFQTDNQSTQSTFYQFWKQGLYSSPIVSFLYCYNSTFGNVAPARSLCNGNDAVQTLGGYHSNWISSGTIQWYESIVFPLVNTIDIVTSPEILNYWALPVTQHLIGDEAQAINKTASGAVFDYASLGRGAPVSVNSYARLIELTGAKPITLDPSVAPNNGAQAFYSVPCSNVTNLPPLKYQFGAGTPQWEIIPQNYVEKITVSSTETACVLNVRTLGDGDWVIGNLGETFAKDKVILFDFDKLQIGIANAA
ncbi:acid protease [Trichoderma citrinoviride]|uniref:Acid protease n=1 Tax=Trichoderma citrinoviride TaxID=58853 RepID=A0A2T4BLD0_9HYPO|nr:acid protease [Trichoderma citrinoviride]PTB70125.1 acid protease [Trichoderma citrinoviride]